MEDLRKAKTNLDDFFKDLNNLEELEDLESPAIFIGSWIVIVSS